MMWQLDPARFYKRLGLIFEIATNRCRTPLVETKAALIMFPSRRERLGTVDAIEYLALRV